VWSVCGFSNDVQARTISILVLLVMRACLLVLSTGQLGCKAAIPFDSVLGKRHQ
jgi:hypothetical protein